MDVFENLKSNSKERLEEKYDLKMFNLRYTSLKNHITRQVGHSKKYPAIAKLVSPRKHTVEEMMLKNVKGSGVYKKKN